jgi:hypothetical protein
MTDEAPEAGSGDQDDDAESALGGEVVREPLSSADLTLLERYGSEDLRLSTATETNGEDLTADKDASESSKGS